ncbi:integrase catalytic domain-containing protein [Trichonephila clavipes]|uniref:Integrase catalytic domain-containing protein n=1 Tax=Trichonephila clavipes TaxID=2585209 RepID=A0A8X6RWZ8_TRICX|nr:integrase catalytic domain-containing protein [Trichonephila clavipes]
MTSSEQWGYVATEENPADFVSRGMDSLKLKTCELWWNGPKFLDEQPVPITTNSCCSDQGSRFVYNCKSKESKRIGPLDLGELKKAEQLLLKLVQKEEFKVEMNGIQNSVMVPSNSRVKTFNPFIDSEGILRVGGRLRNTVHLDIVTDLTSNAFIATLKRFIFRRGKCAKLYSDNATNFVGANIELKKMFNLVCKPDEALASYMASEGIDWKFLLPRAPNFGGLWETGVKSFKFYLKRVVGRSITSIVEPDLTNLNENRLDNWQKITKIIQLIWKRWSVDYLNSLQQRNKWHFEKKNAKIGDMVIIKEDNLPSCQWSLGRINNIYPGKDSKVRVVEVKTTRGIFKRPILKLCILPIETVCV